MRHIKTNLLLFAGILLLLQVKSIAQDLRDFEHTKKFADFLFRSNQFALASEEYERLVYFDSTSSTAKLKLIQSYRLSGKYAIARNRFEALFKDSIPYLNSDLVEEYAKNLILVKEYNTAYHFLDTNRNILPDIKQTYMLSAILLQKDWDRAFNFALKYPVTHEKKNADLHVVAFQSKQLKYKKPFMASLFSMIIPGTGKFYTKNWKDGLISMMFVGLNSWQAYRGFKKYGSQSAYGWVFAGFAGSFYLGNIYGSYKSAKKYNNNLNEEIYHNAWHLTVDNF